MNAYIQSDSKLIVQISWGGRLHQDESKSHRNVELETPFRNAVRNADIEKAKSSKADLWLWQSCQLANFI